MASHARQLGGAAGRSGALGGPEPDAPPGPPSLGYMPALDGVRAFAVAGVMAFHGGIPFLSAGFLGVDTFFVLSGFLITSLLLGEWRHRAAIGLRRFWARRARRLLPALVAVVLFVIFYARFAVTPGTYPGLRGDALSALFYFANWHFIASGGNYFVQTGAVSLLTHTWSLAIEEQFYVLWPLTVLVVLRFSKGLRVLLAICVLGALGSALEMALLYRSGAGLTRLYYGTDTHAQCLLVGAALAVGLAHAASRRHGSATFDLVAPGRARERMLGLLGLVGALATGILWWRLAYDDAFLWQGGFLVAALATASVLFCAVRVPRSIVGRVLSIAPLRYLGRISYGMYLWHFPLFQWLDAQRVGVTGYPLFALRCGATLAVATCSFYGLERPIRHGQVLRHWRAWIGTPAALAGASLATLLTTASAGASASNLAIQLPRQAVMAPGASTGLGGVPANATTVLLLGDSTAVTFGYGLSVDAPRYGADLQDQGILECGVAIVQSVQTGATSEPPGPPCRPSTPVAQQWPALWSAAVDRYHPAVVAVLVGRWEVSNVEWNGTWTNIVNPSFADYVRQQLQQAIDIASSNGAHVALLGAPCYDAGEQPSGAPWPADAINRLDAYNAIARQVVAQNAATTSYVNLDAVVCPGGRFAPSIDGTVVRAPDGIHFPWFTLGEPNAAAPDTLAQVNSFGEWLGPRVWPSILRTR